MKLTDKHFIDWESETFGFGYGSGEEYTLKALKDFFDCFVKNFYDYEQLEKKLGKTVTWLMINILCHADIIEYGTSPRYAWINEKGKLLKKFINNKTVDELCDLTDTDEDYTYCYSDYCNCEANGNVNCENPLFKK